MKKISILLGCFFILTVLLIGNIIAAKPVILPKVDKAVYEKLEKQDKVKVFISLKERSSLSVKAFSKKEVKSLQENVISELSALPEDELNIRYRFDSSFSAEISKEALEKLKTDLRVASIEELGIVHAFLSESVPLINAGNAWPIQINGVNLTGETQTVCIIDTGVNYSHSDLGGCFGNSTNFSCKVISGYDYVNNDADPMDDNGHGTNVAGIVAANGAITGVAPGARIVSIKVLDANGEGYPDTLKKGIDWCVDNSSIFNISVISLSLGCGAYSGYCDSQSGCSNSEIASSIDNAVSNNITVVVATGNAGLSTNISAPACMSNATSVGAVTKSDSVASFSNRNNLTSILAPGVSIISTSISGGSVSMNGTSMATPHVAGAITILKQYKKIEKSVNLTTNELKSLLNRTGKNIPDIDSGLNLSRLNVFAALVGIDETAPNVILSMPLNTTYNSNVSLALNFSAADNLNLSACGYSLDNQNTTITSCLNTTFNTSEGNHVISVYANDSAGNENYSSNVSFYINNTSSVITDYNVSGCSNITVSGSYILNNSITNWGGAGNEPTCINITVSDVEFDCSGWNNWIEGQGVVGTYGVRTEGGNLNNVSIKNCNLSYWWEGISISVENSTLINLTLKSNTYHGVYLSTSSKNNLTDITCSGTDDFGIAFHSSNSNIISNVNISNNRNIGLAFDDSHNNTIWDTISSFNGGFGFLFEGANSNVLVNITASNDHLSGIRFGTTSSAGYNEIINSTIINSQGSEGGITIRYSVYNNITGCRIENNSFAGISILSNSTYTEPNSSYNRIWNNIINNTLNLKTIGENATNYFNTTKVAGTNILGGSWISGNYWSDYKQNDTSGDYIGDIDYITNETYLRDSAALVYSSNYTVPQTPTPPSEGSSSSSSGGGGGGGGATGTTYLIGVIDDNIKVANRELGANDKMKFTLASQDHLLLLQKLTSTDARFQLNSSSQVFELSIKETKKFDLNNDNSYDLAVSLDDIVNKKANVSIKAISDSIFQKEEDIANVSNISNEQELKKQEFPAITGQNLKNIQEKEQFNIRDYWQIAVFVLIIALVVVINKFFKTKKRNNRVKKNKKEG